MVAGPGDVELAVFRPGQVLILFDRLAVPEPVVASSKRQPAGPVFDFRTGSLLEGGLAVRSVPLGSPTSLPDESRRPSGSLWRFQKL
jgi:hypothetical protein